MSAADYLCLACSSSLPPRSVPSSSKGASIFITICCSRPICPNCIASNPRLARYNPCLQCLAGVDLVTARSSSSKAFKVNPQTKVNVDGGLQDEDVFAVGDDEDDDEDDEERYSSEEHQRHDAFSIPSTSSLVDDSPTNVPGASKVVNEPPNLEEEVSLPSETRSPSKYYIKPGDTLLGIALKYKVDGRLLCRLNNLPQSTLRTTPHLLHTRTVLTFPPSAVLLEASTSPSADDSEYEARRARERAEKRLQTLTKEVDWRVAKAYIALADPLIAGADVAEVWKDEAGDKSWRPKETEPVDGGAGSSSLEAAAINRYLDDEDWERREREQGRGVSIPRFPLFESSNVNIGEKPAGFKFWSGWRRN
ncbi:hypothetical protein BDY19DRAFT_994978 [Irpex rosettiformis]|uniref:Uncharacterized protein n=1 Tax=Irpex rosettiformis TaxID=378272 RepID=A0ACB8TYY7_9APHY|nr:hypothetical protein BDY19DRAFT_994978 [Irpex rosettiformis]